VSKWPYATQTYLTRLVSGVKSNRAVKGLLKKSPSASPHNPNWFHTMSSQEMGYSALHSAL
jgi:hypothetical protein